MLLIEIMDKGFGLCPTNYNTFSKGSFSELLFSFVFEKYIICNMCTVKSPAFETTSLLYVTPNDCTSMQELLMQEHKRKLYKTCTCWGRDTWHIESKQILQPPKYLIIIVNRITYSNNRIIKNKVTCLWIYILSWVLTKLPFKLLWTIMDTLWTVVITQPQSIVLGKHFSVTIIKILKVTSRIPIIQILPIYFCTNSSWHVRVAICPEGHLSSLALSSVYSPTVEDGSWSTPMVPAQLSVPLKQVEE